MEWTLRSRRLAIRAEVRSPSLCGAQGFGRIWTRHCHEPRWRTVPPLSALQELLGEAYDRRGAGEAARTQELERLGRILDGYRETARQLDLALREAREDTSFIGAERALVFGHWLHPTPKSRQGLSIWQAKVYGPEQSTGLSLRNARAAL